MKGKSIELLIAVVFLALVFLSPDEENDHIKRSTIKGKVIPPKKIENNIGESKPQDIETPGEDEEYIKCEKRQAHRVIADSINIEIFIKGEVKKSPRKHKYNRGKVLEILKEYGVDEIPYKRVYKTFNIDVKDYDDTDSFIRYSRENGNFLLTFKNYAEYAINDLAKIDEIHDKISKDKKKIITNIENDKRINKYIDYIDPSAGMTVARPANVCRKKRKKPQSNYKAREGKSSFYVIEQEKKCNDPLCTVDNQWALAFGTLVFNNWSATGKGTFIAVIDTGGDSHHEDLRDNTMFCPYQHDFYNGGNNPLSGCVSADEICSGPDCHGVPVMSVAAAVTNNNKGMASLAYNAKILPFRVGESEKGVIKDEAAVNAINYVVGLKKGSFPKAQELKDKPIVINMSFAFTRCPKEGDPDQPDKLDSAYGKAIKSAIDAGIPVVLGTGGIGNCSLSKWHEIAKLEGVILVGAFKLIGSKARGVTGLDMDFARASYSTSDSNMTGLGPGGDETGYYGDTNFSGKGKPEFLNQILTAIKNGTQSNDEGIRNRLQNSIIDKKTDYDWNFGVSFAVPYLSAAVAWALEKNPSLTPKQIEDKILSVCSNNYPGYNKSTDGCGVIIPLLLSASVEAEMKNIPLIMSSREIVNLGNYYDPDNKKPFKITVKNIGGGQLGKVTKEGLFFRNPFKGILTVDIDSEKSWLKVVEIKIIKELQEYEITFTFNKSAQAVNKYAINKNPGKVFEGELIIIPQDQSNNAKIENDVKIPVHLYGGSNAFEEVNEQINIFVYEKNEFETKDNPIPISTSTISKDKNFEFEIGRLDATKEYVIVATTLLSDWYKAQNSKKFYIGQKQINGDEILTSKLTIPIYKFSM